MKKINKGLILTLIVVLGLTIYLVNLEKQRNAEKVTIQKISEQFIELTDKYVVLPQNTQKSIEEYALEMKQELEKLMISNKEDVEFQHNHYKSKLEEAQNKEGQRIGYDRKIVKISDYEFEKHDVTVHFDCEITETTKIGEEEQKNTFKIYGDEIILRKVDGVWKVVYSNLYDNIKMYYNEYYEDSIAIY